ncbi:hypothetical protein ONE63_008103 [Megalurothrips usitatus]|uniref:Uncharacterized protein n=1 Tax=Megalurothrips usitatus TaxID=439358 RepID=A0AAV7XT39_9NEOP|nr:hypothetical protein ONE63_008103 [Megalurothrips usitatus]
MKVTLRFYLQVKRRKAAETIEALRQGIVGLEKDIFDIAGNVHPPSEGIWANISRNMKINMDPKYIYLYFREDRNGIATEVRSKLGLETSAPKRKTSEGCQSEQDEDSAIDDPKAVNQPQEDFLVQIPAEDWKKLKPISTFYKRKDRNSGVRKSWTLPPSQWTPLISKLIWQQHHIPCAFVFKRCTVNMVPEICKNFVDMKDIHCTECNASGRAFIRAPPEDGMPVLHLRTSNTQGVPHSRKRHCFRAEREELGEQLRSKSVSEFRKSEAISKVYEGVSAPNLYSKDVMRKVKEESREKLFREMNIPKGEPIASLLLMKRNGPYVGSIHMVSADPVVVTYHEPSQLQINNTICASGYSRFTLDATGSCVSRVKRQDSLSRPLLNYQITGETREGTVPLNQMISERHDAANLTFWLLDAVRQKFRTPNEFVCDDSKALQSALCRAAAQCCSTREYKDKCLKYLSGTSVSLPKCFIRIDAAHFLKNACQWPFWISQKTPKLVKAHLIRWLGLLMKSKNDTFYGIYENILIVTAAETIGRNQKNELTAAGLSIKSLNALVSRAEIDGAESVGIEEDSDAEQSDEEDDVSPLSDDDEAVSDSCSDLHSALRSIEESAKESSAEVGDEVNPYFHLSFHKKMVEISDDFVLWSAVMVDAFKSPYVTGVSARVEGYINDLKNRVFKGEQLPMDIHKFVGMHLASIQGHVAIASVTATPPTTLASEPTKESEELAICENWRGVSDTKEKKPSKYLSPYPQIEVETLQALDPPKEYLLKNGNLTGFFEIHDGSKVQVKNTCAFDAICQLIAHGILEHASLRLRVEEVQDKSEALQVVWALAHEGAVKGTYCLRAKALVSARTTNLKTTNTVSSTRTARRAARHTVVLSYDSYGNAQEIMRSLNMQMDSTQTEWKCSKGHSYETGNLFLEINSEAFISTGFQGLEAAIKQHIHSEEINCKEKGCLQKSTGTVHVGDSIFINMDFLQHPDISKTRSKYEKKFDLKTVPLNIDIQGKKFMFIGLIAHEPAHYICFTRKISGIWQKFDDYLQHPYTVTKKTLVKHKAANSGM